MKQIKVTVELIIALVLFFASLMVALNAKAGVDPMPSEPMPSGGMPVNEANKYNFSNYNDIGVNNSSTGGSAMATGIAPGGVNSQGGNVSPDAIKNTVNGSTIAPNAINSNSNGAASVSNAGNVHIRTPRQVPPAFSPGMSASYSQANCANSVSVGVSSPFGAIGGGVPYESDYCNARLDSAHFAASGLAVPSCYRFTQIEENAQAMKDSGLTCKQVTKASYAMPVPGAIIPVATPTLDAVMPIHNHPDIVRMIDNQHAHDMAK